MVGLKYRKLFYNIGSATTLYINSNNIFLKTQLLHRVCGVTLSASARRGGGDGFDFRPKPRVS